MGICVTPLKHISPRCMCRPACLSYCASLRLPPSPSLPISPTAPLPATTSPRLLTYTAALNLQSRSVPCPALPSPPPPLRGAGKKTGAEVPGVFRYGNSTLVLQKVPQWVQQSAPYQSALEGLAYDPEPEEGLTVQDAVAAEAALAAANDGSGGAAAAAAGSGTLVAWVYGDGLAYSGSGRDSVVAHDAVSVSAR